MPVYPTRAHAHTAYGEEEEEAVDAPAAAEGQPLQVHCPGFRELAEAEEPGTLVAMDPSLRHRRSERIAEVYSDDEDDSIYVYTCVRLG